MFTKEVSDIVQAASLDELAGANASNYRIERLRAACDARGIDAFLVRNTSNITWLSAFDDVFDDEEAHVLLVTPDRAILHTDSRYSGAAKSAAVGGPISVDDTRETHAKFAVEQLGDALLEQLDCADGRTRLLGIEDSMTLADFRMLEAEIKQDNAALNLVETTDFIMGLRAIKDSSEIARMKAAQAISDAAFSYIITFMRPGMTEREVQVELEDFMRRHGASGLAFPSIVATGPNGANPHAIAGETKLEAGQCVVLDFGARAFGYCSDITRTVFLGAPDTQMRDAYAAIREANERVEAAIAPGVSGAALHEMAEQTLAQAGFAGKMGHGLGHGVGIDVHEEPVLAPRNTKPLEAGNVVTVEPGIYLRGVFGMRLEDYGVVTDSGFEAFTQSTHEPVVL